MTGKTILSCHLFAIAVAAVVGATLIVGCGNGSSTPPPPNGPPTSSSTNSGTADPSLPPSLAPTPGQATLTYTDSRGFRFLAWVANVARPTTSVVYGIAPPGTSFLHLDIGFKSLQTDRPSPLPAGDFIMNEGRDLPFYVQVPWRDLPGIVNHACGSYAGNGLQAEVLADGSGCYFGLRDVGPSGNGQTQAPLPPGGSATVAWETPAVRTGALLSDFQLHTNQNAVSAPKQGLLSLQR